jgi:hypothetical protein
MRQRATTTSSRFIPAANPLQPPVPLGLRGRQAPVTSRDPCLDAATSSPCTRTRLFLWCAEARRPTYQAASSRRRYRFLQERQARMTGRQLMHGVTIGPALH